TISESLSNQSLSDLESLLFENNPSTQVTDIHYEIDDAFQGDDAVQMVRNAEDEGRPYGLIFMDVRMPPGINGIEAIEKIWAMNPAIEVVICTAYSDYSWEEIIQRVGSSDRLLFLKKPFYSAEVKQIAQSLIIKRNLEEKVRGMVQSLEQQVEERTKQFEAVLEELKKSNEELHKKNKALEAMAERDGLTGLLNHSAIHRRLEEIIAENRRHSIPFSVIMMDVDYFKAVNDQYGHQVGDEVLTHLAAVLRSQDWITDAPAEQAWLKLKREIRAYDVAGRYGGDEFAVILPFCPEQSVHSVAERLMDQVRKIRIAKEPKLAITASLGIVSIGDQSADYDGKLLLKLADQALYQSKSGGRNRFSVTRLEVPAEVGR
ncbi:MAG TPA: diguanylate cyclase, partial [Bacillota bacterium]|nr:diguanylate cyclase [Bacillota bacterium]